MDFGLAKRESGEITMTMDGQILGTPAYMSPEQARGGGHQADRRTDIYSLGVILYELLTGERPFRGDKEMLIYQIQRDDPMPPRRINSHCPKDLETICLKCMEKDPDLRFSTAQEVAEDLQRYLRKEPLYCFTPYPPQAGRNLGSSGNLMGAFCEHPCQSSLRSGSIAGPPSRLCPCISPQC